jgi:AraC-like DNA-binding protein
MARSQPIDERDWSWSTKSAAAEDSVRQWASVLTREIAEMAVSSKLDESFSASWNRFGLGPLELNFLRCSQQSVSRSPEMIARESAPYFELLFARRGSIDVSHGGGRSFVPPGGFVLLDDQLSYDLEFPDGSDCLTVRMPEAWLSKWATDSRSLIGRPLGLRSPWGRPLAGLLTAIADNGLANAVLSRSVLSDQLGSMVEMLAGTAHEQSRDRTDTAQRARDTIALMCLDPELDPTRVAIEMCISVRHLHRCLAGAGTSFGRELNAGRLNAAKAMLSCADGPKALALGEIAWRCGYPDQSHFARLFRSFFGCTPTQFRKTRSQ